MEGYPFGSVVPYSFDRDGRLIILISDIAQHTRNINADARVSLTVLDHTADDAQDNARLTVLADAARISAVDDDTAERYYRRFPQSRDYHKTHDFAFYRINPVRLRYIGGFGAIHWLDAGQFVLANPFDASAEAGILNHMNEDHQGALRHYLRQGKGVELPESERVAMVGIDAEGFDVLAGTRLHRFTFDTPIETTKQAREVLVAMTRA